MKKWLTIFVSCMVLGASIESKATPNLPTALINQSKQLVLIIAPHWHSTRAKLWRFEREENTNWKPLNYFFKVDLGKHGLALDPKLEEIKSDLIKKENDGRTPAGVFYFGAAFGFSALPSVNTKLNYLAINNETVCVDDPHSKFYNKILDTNQILQPDWKSVEQMHKVPLYAQGIVIGYNVKNPKAGAGSCVFMHLHGQSKGTRGCVALSKSELDTLMQWLNPSKHPVLVILPEKIYKKVQRQWQLPSKLENGADK